MSLRPSAPVTGGHTLVAHIWPARDSAALRNAALVIGGSLLLWASAKVSVPFWPVPMTMQGFAVLALGLALGSRLATAAIVLYLIEGASGLPVFTGTPEKGIGLAYMMGPTGGYLIGFLLAGFVVGLAADRGWGRHAVTALPVALIGAALIYLPGLAWLGQFVGYGDKLIAVGLLPFIPGDVMKATLAALVVSGTWAVLSKRD